jgi:Domain of unknown function DUF87.
MVMNESHAVVFGPTGAGKTRFIDNALSNLGDILPSHTVVVLDVTGGYEGYTDYHAPYPLNVVRELNPVILPRVLGEVFRIDGDEKRDNTDNGPEPGDAGLLAPRHGASSSGFRCFEVPEEPGWFNCYGEGCGE